MVKQLSLSKKEECDDVEYLGNLDQHQEWEAFIVQSFEEKGSRRARQSSVITAES